MTKTLVIIGAGSSKNVHHSFPTGIELANLIDVHLITTKKRQNNNDYHSTAPYISSMINVALRIFKYEVSYLDYLIDELKIELWAYVQEYYYHNIRTGAEPISIDNLIATRFKSSPPIRNLAKHCIWYLLKGQESAYLATVPANSNATETWIDYMFSHLKSKGVTYDEIRNTLRVISFNYERLFEYLSCKAIKKVFNETISGLPFIDYIYGNIGNIASLPFQTSNDKTDDLEGCYLNIKLMDERDNTEKKPCLDDFDKVLFIGFGYDKENLNDTLSIQPVKSAKLFGMCMEKTAVYEKAEKDFKITITQYGDKIKDFIRDKL